MLILLNSNILFKNFTEGDEINGHKNHNFVKFLDNLVTFPSFSHPIFSHFYYLKNRLYLFLTFCLVEALMSFCAPD